MLAPCRAITIQVPTQDSVLFGQEAPLGGGSDGSFAYPEDGSMLQVQTVTGRATVKGFRPGRNRPDEDLAVRGRDHGRRGCRALDGAIEQGSEGGSA